MLLSVGYEVSGMILHTACGQRRSWAEIGRRSFSCVYLFNGTLDAIAMSAVRDVTTSLDQCTLMDDVCADEGEEQWKTRKRAGLESAS